MAKTPPSRKSASPRSSREGSKSTLKAALEKHKADIEKKKKRPAAQKKKAAPAPPKDPFARFKKPVKKSAPAREPQGPEGRDSKKRREAPQGEAPRGAAPRSASPREETSRTTRKSAPAREPVRKETFPPIGGQGVKGEPAEGADEMRLNKFLSHAGIASRRAADTLIMQGHVTVNGVVVQEMGYKVQPNDVIKFKGETIRRVEKLVYYLLNKPRNVMSTVSDERGRKTVMDILARKVKERVYPVGRLDRNTSGLILLTNDGALTKKLSHPSHKVPKVYHVTLDRAITEKDMNAIRNGIMLEDGAAKADSLHYMEDMSKREVQIELHSGKNRIVRRMFEHLGYEVVKLDRTYYAGLTKKNLPRGFFRPLTIEEIRMLKHFT